MLNSSIYFQGNDIFHRRPQHSCVAGLFLRCLYVHCCSHTSYYAPAVFPSLLFGWNASQNGCHLCHLQEGDNDSFVVVEMLTTVHLCRLILRKKHLKQWCSNRGPRVTCGPQGPLEWPAKQFSLERKLNTLII